MTAAALLLLALVQPPEKASPGFADYQRANQLFVAQKFQESLDAVDRALSLDPKLLSALTLKAKLAMAANRLDVAREILVRAIAAHPKSANAQFLYGLQFYMQNDLSQALPAFESARRLDTGDARAALYLGMTVESLGRNADALALYQEAARLEKASGKPNAATLLAAARLLFLLDRLAECRTYLQSAAGVDPRSRDVHFEMARLLLREGDAGGAAREAELALSLPPGDTAERNIHYLLVRAYTTAGKPDESARHAEALRKLDGGR